MTDRLPEQQIAHVRALEVHAGDVLVAGGQLPFACLVADVAHDESTDHYCFNVLSGVFFEASSGEFQEASLEYAALDVLSRLEVVG